MSTLASGPILKITVRFNLIVFVFLTFIDYFLKKTASYTIEETELYV